MEEKHSLQEYEKALDIVLYCEMSEEEFDRNANILKDLLSSYKDIVRKAANSSH